VQKRLPEIQNKRGVGFARAWTGCGFHEDGFTSGIRAGKAFGGVVPWGEIVDSKFVGGDAVQRKVGPGEKSGRILISLFQWIIASTERLTAVGNGKKDL
jgi:hypothetical protein